MNQSLYSRNIEFESVFNFRDLGGYQTKSGHTVAWRKLFRSGTLHSITNNDADKLKAEIGLLSVLDLRSNFEIDKDGIGLVPEFGFNYYNISLIPDGGERKTNEQRYNNFTNMYEFYLYLAQQSAFIDKIIKSLAIISKADNHPILFHCSAGKDRTGILAAILLNILGVADKDVVNDYTLTTPYMELIRERIRKSPRSDDEANNLPEFFWEAIPESMEIFLSSLQNDYGSIRDYLIANGAEKSLFERLERALLV